MEKPVRKIGNSQGIILPKMILDSVGIQVGDLLRTKVRDGKIILEPMVVK